ncbi:MAG: WD40 repeat domain-containing protein [Candidatus Berkelbacteria bacterium]|nr:WD40 repeat domain-containing protein [Candidatus Berkelbacteria bacterium]
MKCIDITTDIVKLQHLKTRADLALKTEDGSQAWPIMNEAREIMGKYLISWEDYREIRRTFFDAEKAMIPGNEKYDWPVVLSLDRKTIAGLYHHDEILTVSLETGEELRHIKLGEIARNCGVRRFSFDKSLAFSPDGRKIAFMGVEDKLASRPPVLVEYDIPGDRATVNSPTDKLIDYDQEGNLVGCGLVYPYKVGYLNQHGEIDKPFLNKLYEPNIDIRIRKFYVNGNNCLEISEKGKLTIWDQEKEEAILYSGNKKEKMSTINDALLFDSGQKLMVLTGAGILAVYDMKREEYSRYISGYYSEMAIDPAGRFLVATDTISSELRIFNLRNYQQIGTIQINKGKTFGSRVKKLMMNSEKKIVVCYQNGVVSVLGIPDKTE